MQYSINDIKEKLASIDNEKAAFITEISNDERKGVQLAIQQWHKKREKEILIRDKFDRMMQYERDLYTQGYQYIAGVDEVGRGPLAGPVVAAAVILPEDFYLGGLNDSKQLSEKKREMLYTYIMEHAVAVGIGSVTPQEIDKINIYQASKKAMMTAISNLTIQPDYLLIDAMELSLPIKQTGIIKGDAKSVSIAAASIVAKVHRDRLMKEWSKTYPSFDFDKNMGYGTKTHLEALENEGPTPIHRLSFAPVRNAVK